MLVGVFLAGKTNKRKKEIVANNDDLIIDLSNYKDRVGSRIAPGRYRVQVEDVEITESAAKNPMINLWFRVVGGEFDGQTVTDRLVLTEKSLFRVVGFMMAIRLPTPKKRLKVNVRQFVGRVLEIDVEDGEPYNGRIRSEVRAYYRVEKAGGEDLENDFQDLAYSSAADLPESDETSESTHSTPASEPESKPESTASPVTSESEDEDEPVDLDSVEL